MPNRYACPAPSPRVRYNRLDLNLLPALKALLTEKSVTRAGELLHVTQPAMSRMLGRLREYFDDPLIVPVGRRMELTPLAEGLIDKVNHLLLQVDTTLATQPQFDPAQSRRQYSIVASDYVTTVLLMDVVKEVGRIAPDVSIELVPITPSSPEALEAGEVDLLVGPDVYTSLGQLSAALFEETYHGVVDRDHPGIGDSITLDQYMAHGHVFFRNRGWPLFDSYFSQASGRTGRSTVCVNTFGLVAPMVMGTDRIAVLQTRLARHMAQLLPVRLVRLDFEMPRLIVMMQWHRYRDLDPASVWLRELIVRHAQRLSPVTEV